MSSPMLDEAGKAYIGSDGTLYPRVTGILNAISKPALPPSAVKITALYIESLVNSGEPIDWLDVKREYRRQWDAKREDGTVVHKAIETVVATGELPEDYELSAKQLQIVDQYFNWVRAFRPEYIASEVTVFSDTHRYAGTVDFIAMIGDRLVLGDFKTGEALWPDVALQLAAYAHADYMYAGGKSQPLPAFDDWCVVQLRPDYFVMRAVRPELRDLAWQRFVALRDFASWHQDEAKTTDSVLGDLWLPTATMTPVEAA